ncbi:MAG TPA: cysteine--tRNA ligase [Candidatus Saccharimonadia bacterium]|nr:cysteine--tRNA ligase [Candidatus Saccharimonadia bacterium]
MKLHNTLTRTVEDLEPHSPGTVTLYTCGPTVYDYAHIGNLRKFIFDDVLRRTLEATGLTVRHVMNITDVGHLVADEDESILSEDKFEKGARREGKSVWDVAAQYTEAFKADMKALNVLPPNVDPKRTQNHAAGDPYARATDFIPEQIDMVERLLKNGYAYQTQQAIYFDIQKLAGYGKLTGQDLGDKEVGARSEVVTDPHKHHPHDFAVWFFTTGHFADHTMRWPSPWGDGFPGWHLECSAIIHATLGDPIDIHTGGIDHIGTHHPNEMAQTEGAFGHDLARLWVHSEHLLVEGAKMSKSKDNFYTLANLTEQGFHPLAFRLLMLQAHYRSQLNFTLESLDSAQNTLLNLYAWADLKHQTGLAEIRLGDDDLSQFLDRIKLALADDLSTTRALAELFGYSTSLAPGMTLSPEDFEPLLASLDDLFGLRLAGRPDINDAAKALIAERETAREAKNWAAADKLRKQLAKHDLEISDTPNGPRWRRATTRL